MAISRYVALTPIRHNGKLFAVGEALALSDAQAASLGTTIAPQAGALPTMPPDPPVPVMAVSSGSGPVFQDGDEAHAIVVAELDGGGNPTGNFTQTAGLFRSAGREEPLQ